MSPVTNAVTTAIAPPTTTRQITNVDTLDPIVPPSPPEPGPAADADILAHRHRRLWWVLGTVGVLLVAALISAAFIQLPYYAFAPGSARATESLVEVDGAETYPAHGSINFTTVSIRKVTVLEAVR